MDGYQIIAESKMSNKLLRFTTRKLIKATRRKRLEKQSTAEKESKSKKQE